MFFKNHKTRISWNRSRYFNFKFY